MLSSHIFLSPCKERSTDSIKLTNLSKSMQRKQHRFYQTHNPFEVHAKKGAQILSNSQTLRSPWKERSTDSIKLTNLSKSMQRKKHRFYQTHKPFEVHAKKGAQILSNSQPIRSPWKERSTDSIKLTNLSKSMQRKKHRFYQTHNPFEVHAKKGAQILSNSQTFRSPCKESSTDSIKLTSLLKSMQRKEHRFYTTHNPFEVHAKNGPQILSNSQTFRSPWKERSTDSIKLTTLSKSMERKEHRFYTTHNPFEVHAKNGPQILSNSQTFRSPWKERSTDSIKLTTLSKSMERKEHRFYTTHKPFEVHAKKGAQILYNSQPF